MDDHILDGLTKEFQKLNTNDKEKNEKLDGFSTELQENCYKFMRLSDVRKKCAENIYNIFIKEHVEMLPKENALYIKDILIDKKFAELRESLKVIFEQLLSTNIETSLYGLGIISDFDLLHNFNKIKGEKMGYDDTQIKQLIKSKSNLKKYINRGLVKGVIENFPLEYEFEKEEPVVTPDVKQASQQLSTSAKKAFNTEQEEKEKEVEPIKLDYNEEKQPVDEKESEANNNDDNKEVVKKRKTIPRPKDKPKDLFTAIKEMGDDVEDEGEDEADEDEDEEPNQSQHPNPIARHMNDISHSKNKTNQYFGTTTELLDNLHNNLDLIIDPADFILCDPMCGKANILKYFAQKYKFHSIHGFDLFYPHVHFMNNLWTTYTGKFYDFLEDKNVEQVLSSTDKKIIITNTPFSPLNQFIERLLYFEDISFITIVPIYTLAYKSLKKLFAIRPNSFVISNGKRRNFELHDGNLKGVPFVNVWVVSNSNTTPAFKIKTETSSIRLFISIDDEEEIDVEENV